VEKSSPRIWAASPFFKSTQRKQSPNLVTLRLKWKSDEEERQERARRVKTNKTTKKYVHTYIIPMYIHNTYICTTQNAMPEELSHYIHKTLKSRKNFFLRQYRLRITMVNMSGTNVKIFFKFHPPKIGVFCSKHC
jgi:hypothetical protein